MTPTLTDRTTEAAMSKWQTIETAPQDGTHILAYGPEPVRNPIFVTRETHWRLYGEGSIAHRDYEAGKGPSGSWDWVEPIHNWGCSWHPTHWMPLPPPPSPATPHELVQESAI